MSAATDDTVTKDRFVKRRKNATPVPCSRGLPFRPRIVPVQYGRQPSRRAIKSPRIGSCHFMKRYINRVEEEELWNSSQEMSEFGSQIGSQDNDSTLISASQKVTNAIDDELTTQVLTIDSQSRFDTESVGRTSEYITCSSMSDTTGLSDTKMLMESEDSSKFHRMKEKGLELPKDSLSSFQKELIEFDSIEMPRKLVGEENHLEMSPIHTELIGGVDQLKKRRRQQEYIEEFHSEEMSTSSQFIEISNEEVNVKKCSTKALENQPDTLPYPDLSSVRDIDSVVSSQQQIQETTPARKTSQKCPRRGHQYAKKERVRRASKILTSTVIDSGKTSALQELLPSDISISSVKSAMTSDVQTLDKEKLDTEDSSQPLVAFGKVKERRVTSTPMKSRVKEGLLTLMSLDVSSVHREESDMTLMNNCTSLEVNSQEIVPVSDTEEVEGTCHNDLHINQQILNTEQSDKHIETGTQPSMCQENSYLRKGTSEEIERISQRMKNVKQILNIEPTTKKVLSRDCTKCPKECRIPPHQYPPCFLTNESIAYPSSLSAKVMVCTHPRKYCSYNDLIENTPVDFLELMD